MSVFSQWGTARHLDATELQAGKEWWATAARREADINALFTEVSRVSTIAARVSAIAAGSKRATPYVCTSTCAAWSATRWWKRKVKLHKQETGVRALQGELWSVWVGRVGD